MRYAALVAARKAYDSDGMLGLANPSRVAGGRFDSDEIGPWTRWAGDLDADLMIVGQDWGDVDYFIRHQGMDAPGNPTNVALARLLESVGRPLPLPPTASTTPPNGPRSRVFLTNALLWLKTGGLSAPVDGTWFAGDGAMFLREQIALVRPRVVVGLGQQAHRAVLRSFDLPLPRGAFRLVVEDAAGTRLRAVPGEPLLLGVYHCGARVRNTIRSLEDQVRDWRRVARALGAG